MTKNEEFERLKKMAEETGFTHAAFLDVSTIQLMPEVRQMCASNSCHMYDKSWNCPPACGSLEECEKKIRRYQWGILVQTVGELEDSLDGEGMMEAESAHKKNFVELEKLLRPVYPEMLAIGAGACTKCVSCTYPDEPCRFPGQSFASMEAYGMLVTQVCQDNQLPYYYGPCTIAYTSCFLIA